MSCFYFVALIRNIMCMFCYCFNSFEHNSSIVQELLEVNSSLLKTKDKWGKSPLHLACQCGHHMVVQYILQSPHYSEDILKSCDEKGNTPMHLACKRGDSGIVILLIKKGAETNATNGKERTPVHTAAKYGSVDVVKVLVQEHKEPIKYKDYLKRTPLHLAAKYNQVDMIKFLHEW